MGGQQGGVDWGNLMDFLLRYKMGNQQQQMQREQLDWQKKQDELRFPLEEAFSRARTLTEGFQQKNLGAQTDRIIKLTPVEINQRVQEAQQAALAGDAETARRKLYEAQRGEVSVKVGQSLASFAPETPSNITNALATNYDRVAQGGTSELPYFDQGQMAAVKQRGASAMGAKDAFVAQATAAAEAASRPPPRYSLSQGENLVDAEGNVKAAIPPKAVAPKQMDTGDMKAYRDNDFQAFQGLGKDIQGAIAKRGDIFNTRQAILKLGAFPDVSSNQVFYLQSGLFDAIAKDWGDGTNDKVQSIKMIVDTMLNSKERGSSGATTAQPSVAPQPPQKKESLSPTGINLDKNPSAQKAAELIAQARRAPNSVEKKRLLEEANKIIAELEKQVGAK
jgi:hypothetical protein